MGQVAGDAYRSEDLIDPRMDPKADDGLEPTVLSMGSRWKTSEAIDVEPHGQMYRSAGGPVISIWWAAAISSSSASDTLACPSATLSLSK